MAFVPKFQLYDSTNSALLYTFPVVQRTNIPQSPIKTVEIEGQRGIGSLIINGGVAPWDAFLEGVLDSVDYEAMVVKMDALETAVQANTAYYLRLDKTSSTYYSYKVKRIVPIEYPESLRNGNEFQNYILNLRVNSW